MFVMLSSAVIAAPEIAPEAEKTDVICFQEIFNAKSYDMMTTFLPDYEFVGPGTKMNNSKHTGVYTAVKKDTCDILGWESIYLSDEPYTPDSRFEGQSHNPRICVQTLIRHKASKKIVRVFNTHLDHASEDARVKGMNVVLNFIDSFKEKGGYPIMLMGDFYGYINRVKTHADKLGVKLVQAHSPMGKPLLDEDGALSEATRKCIEACGRWGIENVVVHSGYRVGLTPKETFEE